ncbi:MAG TPA: NADH-quinone oxidoreductase subunit N [Terriglobales bacterium]|nr:NADH-quinone oxidoreductase subunit N [Terriglobales bacterium]
MPTHIVNFFTSTDYTLALPMIMLAVFGLGILLIDLGLPKEWKRANAWTALIGLGFSAAAVLKVQGFSIWDFRFLQERSVVGRFGYLQSMTVDSFSVYFYYLFIAGAAIAVLMSIKYLEIEQEDHGEFYALILFSVIGMMAMASGFDLVMLFIGLELMAISTYVLVGFLRRDRRSNEAALKYLLLGAFSSGIFAYGLSLFYGLTGSTNLLQISARLQEHMATHPNDPIAIFAMLTTSVGLLFKIAAVPFHQWAPDAYEGAPTSVTGFMSVAVKAAGWAMLLRIFLWGLPAMRPIYVPLLTFVAILTLTGGNLAALTQNNLKRLLAYSSISHVGFMLLGLVASNPQTGGASATGVKGIMFYLLVYTFMNLGAFAVITSLRRREIIGDELDDIAGLITKAPTQAILMLCFLLSLAGIPPLAGFWGKYFIFLSLIESGNYVLAAVGILYSVLGLYYYLRIANAMIIKKATDTEPVTTSPGLAATLAITAAGTIVIGVFPNMFIEAATKALSLPVVSQVVTTFSK